MKLLIYSKALYSTWIYYSPDRILFDAGEGASSILGNKSFAIKRIFLSHGHADHISGLMGLINIRNSGMGDTEKELLIYYPKGSFFISELITYFDRTNRYLNYHLEWIPLTPGTRIPLLDGQIPRYIETFPTVHVNNEPSLGYTIVENRTRLHPDLAGLTQREITQLVRQQGRESVTATYSQRLFTYGGDSVPIKVSHIEGTEVLCHDATFLDEQDRQEYKHATLDEAIEVARAAHVKKELIAIHISGRYKDKMRKLIAASGHYAGLGFKVTLVPPGKIFVVD
jgi:ribonuclease Z